MTTAISLFATPTTLAPAIGDKPQAGLPFVGIRLAAFDTWRPGYGGANVEVIEAGTADTLAPLFYDISLSQPAPNPQTLISFTDENGTIYGKWAKPLYTAVGFTLYVNSTDSTGIEYPPLISLPGQDASAMLVSSVRGQYPITLATFSDTSINAALYGPLSYSGGSAAATTTLNAAIGAAAAQGGGDVDLPAGVIPITSLNLPQGVVLVGDNLNSTTLQCTQTGNVITLGGDGAGLRNLTLDGVDLVSGSVGVFGLNPAEPIMENVLIKRFDTGMLLKGASAGQWRNLSISNCNTNADFRGDADATGTHDGGAFANMEWDGGAVSLGSNYGVRLRFIDNPAREITLRNVGFASNVGPALHLHGVRGLIGEDCYWTSNIVDMLIEDDTNSLYQNLNTTERIVFDGGQISAGTLTFNQSCVGVALKRMDLKGVSYNLTVPSNPILILDCIEDSACTSTGDNTKIIRFSSFDEGIASGVTVGATPVVAWEYNLAPGQAGLFSAEVIAKRRDGTTYGIFWPMTGAVQPGATLPFSVQTSNFTAGAVVTGATSAASARIVAVTQSGGAGTLTLRSIAGTFITGELIQDTSGGSARVNGTVTTYASALDGTGSGNLRAATCTGSSWAAVWAVTASLVQLVVTGEANATIEWTAKVTKTAP